LRQSGRGQLLAPLLTILLTLFVVLPAMAVEPIDISRDDVALDLSKAVQIYRNQGSTFQVSTAAGTDGIVRRIEVEASSPHSSGDWACSRLPTIPNSSSTG
jgi:hypothetical protein